MISSETRRKDETPPGFLRAPGKASILVVDDDEMILAIVKRVLSSEYCVDTADGAAQALTLLDAGSRYVAIVCDLSMPVVGGLELLQLVRERDAEMPVVILTGHGNLQIPAEKAPEAGYRCLTKPFEHEDLLGAVREVSANRRIELLRLQAAEDYDSGAWQMRSSEELDLHFDEALRNVWMAFQPIVQEEGQAIYGYEALVRSTGPILTSPKLLFDAAERLQRVRDVGREVRRKVAAQIPRSPVSSSIFVNLHALELSDDDLFSPSAQLSLHAERVVLEITECASLKQLVDLRDRISQLKSMGFRIAVDCLGAEHPEVFGLSQLSSDIAKLDMSLIRGIDTDPRKASIVRSLLAMYQRDQRARVVCEGIETRAELLTLRSLGPDLLQGYLFGRPAREFKQGQLFPV